ncbi:MAG: AAA family ATPase [Paludibacteraceae bacterium]|nr:AAA family ATPase [Paludibacteraceae bacterium]
MKRKIYNELLNWKQSDSHKVALLIEGARRIGKSFIVEEFGRNEYDSYLLIDFNKASSQVKKLFDLYLEDLDTLFELLEQHYQVRLVPRHSLIIFDEVQDCPRARAAIKYLVADGRFDYIETGSLVSIQRNVKNIVIPSEERAIQMHPMDFEEFLWAMGNETLMPYIRKQFAEKKPMREVHQQAMDYFRRYLMVGGMPQAVEQYVQTRDLEQVDRVKRDILTIYRNDIRKYAGRLAMKVMSVFDEIPAQLRKNERRFCLADLNKSARMRDYENAFMWLSEAKIVECAYNTVAPNIGLRLNMDRTTLKCYMADTGLLLSMAFDEKGIIDEQVYKKLLLDKLEVNMGMLMENMVAQMLVAEGNQLYFYSKTDRNDSSNTMEIDFLLRKSQITNRHNIIPIEVKSSNGYTLHSLRKCVNKFGEYVTDPTVLATADMGKADDRIQTLPLYMTSCL